MKSLHIIKFDRSWSETGHLLSQYVNNFYREPRNSNPIEILEAGCGKQWSLDLNFDYALTGVDLSLEAMEIRKNEHGDIDHFIVGDLATVNIDENAFDVVYCSFVLEHLVAAEVVLDQFFKWLRPGGLAILIFPDRDSVFGFVTRLTPHWFHVFYYRYIVKIQNAGKPGHGPFPTHYDAVVSRRGIHNYCRNRGYEIALEFGQHVNIPRSAGAFRPLITAFMKLLAMCSFGRLTDRHQNLALIIKNP